MDALNAEATRQSEKLTRAAGRHYGPFEDSEPWTLEEAETLTVDATLEPGPGEVIAAAFGWSAHGLFYWALG